MRPRIPKLAAACLLGISLLGSGCALAEASVQAGEAKSMTCKACHGENGNSLNPEWPSLAGQNQRYIINSLRAYKSGSRKNVLMSAQALPLSDQDIADLAAYYAQQEPVPRTADPAMVAVGERLYRGGNIDTGVSACLACHGPAGRGNEPAGYPALAGQHARYTANQLTAYAKQQRTSDPGQMMRNIAALLSDDEIAAVASYIQGLREQIQY
jgi:cytochrome c553